MYSDMRSYQEAEMDIRSADDNRQHVVYEQEFEPNFGVVHNQDD